MSKVGPAGGPDGPQGSDQEASKNSLTYKVAARSEQTNLVTNYATDIEASKDTAATGDTGATETKVLSRGH